MKLGSMSMTKFVILSAIGCLFSVNSAHANWRCSFNVFRSNLGRPVFATTYYPGGKYTTIGAYGGLANKELHVIGGKLVANISDLGVLQERQPIVLTSQFSSMLRDDVAFGEFSHLEENGDDPADDMIVLLDGRRILLSRVDNVQILSVDDSVEVQVQLEDGSEYNGRAEFKYFSSTGLVILYFNGDYHDFRPDQILSIRQI